VGAFAEAVDIDGPDIAGAVAVGNEFEFPRGLAVIDFSEDGEPHAGGVAAEDAEAHRVVVYRAAHRIRASRRYAELIKSGHRVVPSTPLRQAGCVGNL